jgi:hypothetical protein
MEYLIKKDPEELQNILREELVPAAKQLLQELGRARGLDGLWQARGRIVELVEVLGEEYSLIGEDKRALAVEALLILIPDSWAPDWALRPFLGWGVDRAVAEMKKRGPEALQKVKEALKARFKR